jgi:hypothetical protein
MTPDESPGDPALARQGRAAAAAANGRSARWMQIAGGTLLAAWCLTYLIGVVQQAAAVHGL